MKSSDANFEKLEEICATLEKRLSVLKKLKNCSDESKSLDLPLYIPSKEMAEAIGITENDLTNLRNHQKEHKYSKPGKKNCYYELSILLSWLPTRTFNSSKEEKEKFPK